MQPSPKRLLLFAVIIAFVVALIQIGMISVAFGKLGLSQDSAFLLLMATLAGSMFNLPLFTMQADPDAPPPPEPPPALAPYIRLPPFDGRINVVVNVGGAMVPVTFSLYLLMHSELNLFALVLATIGVTVVAKRFSWVIPGLGIAMPMLMAPILAAVMAWLLDPAHRAPLAYISGTMGVLIGTDLLRLNDIRKLGTRVASIGGGGTLDGVFLTGIIAVLLA